MLYGSTIFGILTCSNFSLLTLKSDSNTESIGSKAEKKSISSGGGAELELELVGTGGAGIDGTFGDSERDGRRVALDSRRGFSSFMAPVVTLEVRLSLLASLLFRIKVAANN